MDCLRHRDATVGAVTLQIDLEGKRALVTGAGQGVGRCIASTLAQAGASVLINDVVESRAKEVAEAIRDDGGSAEAAAFDVTEWRQVETGIRRLEGLDILVNNAGNAGVEGFAALRPFAESDPGEWDRYIRVNLYGVMNCTRAVLPEMIEREGGRIITIVSDAARYGDAYLAPYAAAKAGAAGFCRSIAREVGRYNITVNCVAMGTVRTPTTKWPDEDSSQAKARDEERLRKYIIRRRGEPEDAAGLVAYLASPSSSWITGQTYPVNGGYSLAL
jgi:NAD(P)-dependent dehydrogenase (short-subunit alcohol dehydrogenase family)